MPALVTTRDLPLAAPAARAGILATKFHIPRVRAHLVPRPALVAAIDTAAQRSLTLICAPAGYGKSTLVVQWLSQVGIPAAWASLDREDNDHTGFFRIVVTALQTIDREIAAGTYELLDGQGVVYPQLIAGSLLHELAAVTRPFVLVLDDYDAVDSPEIHEGIAFLLQNLPPSMRVVLIARTEPPLPLARLRAHDDVLELRAQDLRFTRDEALSFLQESHGLDLAPGEVDVLNERTEGWVAGLQLVAHALRGQPREQVRRIAAEIGGSVRFVEEYLWEEALRGQPEAVRTFLLRTSILDRFDAQLCNAVVGTTDGAELLRRCERANLFLIPLDDLGHWYRYHHLFADVLRDRLAQEASDAEVGALHRRAAAWLEEHAFVEEAIRHAIAGRDWERAVRLLEQLCAELYAQDRHTQLRGWLEGLPPEMLERNPRLAFYLAWALGRAGQYARALQPLAIAEHAWTAADDRANLGAVLMWHALHRLSSYDVRRSIDYANRALDLLPADRPDDRAVATLLLGTAHHLHGEPIEAERTLAGLRVKLEDLGRLWLNLSEMAMSGGVLIQQGKLLEATVLLRRVVKLGDSRFALAIQNALCRLGEVYVEWDMLEEGERHFREAEQLAEQTGAVIWRPQICLGLARLAWARGEPEAAFDEVERAIEYAGQRGSVQQARHARAELARFWLASGQLALAHRWAESCELDPYLPPEYERQIEHLTFVRFLIQDGRPDLALRVLDAVQRRAEASGRAGELVELHVLRALAHKAGGDHPSALFALDRALALGAPAGYVRVFADEGEALAPLLRHAAARGAHRDDAQRLLAAVEGTAAARPAPAGGAEALSDREVEVLRLVAAGLPNREVGLRLFISEKTVKKHLSNILGKLGATNRTQAVDQARRLELL